MNLQFSRPTWPMYMKFVEIICDVDRKKASDDAGSTGAEYVLAILSMMSEKKVGNHAQLLC